MGKSLFHFSSKLEFHPDPLKSVPVLDIGPKLPIDWLSMFYGSIFNCFGLWPYHTLTHGPPKQELEAQSLTKTEQANGKAEYRTRSAGQNMLRYIGSTRQTQI